MSYIPRFLEASVHKGVFGERQELRTCEVTKNLSHSSISDMENMWQCHGSRSLCKLQPRWGAKWDLFHYPKLDVKLYIEDSRITIEIECSLSILLSCPRYTDGRRPIERQLLLMSVLSLR